MPDTRSAALMTGAIALTAVMFGLVPLFARVLQAQGLGDPVIAFSRYFFSALALAPFLPRAAALRRQALLMGGAGLLMGVSWLSYLEALETQPVAALGVVYMSYPLFAVLLGWLLAGLRPTARSLGACGLILAGAALLMAGQGATGADPRMLAMALPAPVFFGLIIVTLTVLTPDLTALQKMACGMVGAALGLTPLALTAPWDAAPPITAELLALVLGLATVTALAPQLLYTLAAPRVGPVRAAAAGAFELPTMIAVGWLAFGERLSATDLAAAALVLAAIAMAPVAAAAPARRAPTV